MASQEGGGSLQQRHEVWNWPLCLTLVVVSFAGSVWCLMQSKQDFECNARAGELPALIFNVAVAFFFSSVLALAFLDHRPFVVDYVVVGRPEIPAVKQSFRGYGRWITFTLWSNTLGTCYYWTASVVGLMVQLEISPPSHLCIVQQLLWEMTLPMSFLINIVVTFALIPMINKQGKYESLWWMTRWRSLSLHNGFCLAAAIECGLATPRVVVGHLPIMIIYGLIYVIFAYGLWCRLGIYVYFFFDPRFKNSPSALLALLLLLAVLYFLSSQAASAAAGAWSWPVRGGLLLLALGTCTWQHPNAKAPPGEGGPTQKDK